MTERPDAFDETQRELSGEERQQVREIDDEARRMRALFNSIGRSTEMSLALANLEQATMWAKKHVMM